MDLFLFFSQVPSSDQEVRHFNASLSLHCKIILVHWNFCALKTHNALQKKKQEESILSIFHYWKWRHIFLKRLSQLQIYKCKQLVLIVVALAYLGIL